MRASATRTNACSLSPLAVAPFDGIEVIGFKNSQAGVEQFALGDDHDVEALGDFVSTKDLSNQSFSAVSLDRSAQLLGRRDSQPADRERVGQDENRAVSAMDARAL